MKVPKEIRTFCPRCGSHQLHVVELYKRGRTRTLAEGQRRYLAKQKGYGGQKKPIQRKFSKITKKQVMKLKCKTCGHIQHKHGIRLKKIEIVA